MQNPYVENRYLNKSLISDPVQTASLSNSLSFTDAGRSPAAEPMIKNVDAPVVLDESGPIGKGVVESGEVSQVDFDSARGTIEPQAQSFNGMGAMGGAGKAMAGGGGAEDAVAGGLMASGNPYAMAAGLALSAYNQNSKEKYAVEQENVQREVNHRKSMYDSARANQQAYERMRNIAG